MADAWLNCQCKTSHHTTPDLFLKQPIKLGPSREIHRDHKVPVNPGFFCKVPDRDHKEVNAIEYHEGLHSSTRETISSRAPSLAGWLLQKAKRRTWSHCDCWVLQVFKEMPCDPLLIGPFLSVSSTHLKILPGTPQQTYILKSSSSSSSSVLISCSGRETIGSNWGSWLDSSAFSVEVSWSS